ncbi:hypothetical protein AWENTII_003267 [Aspergillus wentii]
MFAGFGNGLEDSAWNAWIGNMANANEMLGLLHGLYGVGGVLSPLVATSLITKASLPWYYFYYILIACSVVELVICTVAFWEKTGQVFREATAQSHDADQGGLRQALFRRPSARITWICAVFLLGYVGIEVALGGWIVTFMIRVRHGSKFASGMVATGFWLGITIGRVVLGFVTPRIGEKNAISVSYIVYLVKKFQTDQTDLYPLLHGLQPRPLADPQLLRLRRRRLFPGFLPGPIIPCGRSRHHETTPSPSACQFDWICRCFWRSRSCYSALLGGRNRAGQGCCGVAAIYSCAAGGDIFAVAGIAQGEE